MDNDLASVNKEYIYKQFRQKYPHVVQPSKVMQVEERRGLWTIFGNLNQWFDGSKKCLVHLGFAKDKPIKVIDMFDQGYFGASCFGRCSHNAVRV